ncbi:hypothetical protein Ppa06_57550 [Planomonospora parontospora subsp. parontospora]|uniref:Uncharacterized protein n=2 Tax=Planomonospora parontospora TaxID=58119 RepID=A0AA37BM80_9ACTN|nr:hypothetical protein [Planomonospora parontospora]GGK90772.1 hypothetical protein GCM10010126_57760 [Planomonospora parontospora]GII11957.1 hypothetical protein Ppa06_57550 [Planomonospora parontospora subsp. parontospora]
MTETTLCIAPRCGAGSGPRQAVSGHLTCTSCLTRCRRDLAGMPAIVHWLGLHTIPGGAGGEKVSGSREKPVPVRLDVLAAISPAAEHVTDLYGDQTGPPSIPTTLKSWVWLICEHRGLTYPERADAGELAGFLLRHLDWAAARPWIGELIGEVAHLRKVAHTLAPWEVHVQALVAPCPSCDIRALMRIAGEPYIECDQRIGGCGNCWTEAEYERHVAELTSA